MTPSREVYEAHNLENCEKETLSRDYPTVIETLDSREHLTLERAYSFKVSIFFSMKFKIKFLRLFSPSWLVNNMDSMAWKLKIWNFSNFVNNSLRKTLSSKFERKLLTIKGQGGKAFENSSKFSSFQLADHIEAPMRHRLWHSGRNFACFSTFTLNSMESIR